MRRALLALLSTVATLVALVGSKYFVTASTGAATVPAELRALDEHSSGDDGKNPDALRSSPSARPSTSSGVPASAGPSQSTTPDNRATTPPATTPPNPGGGTGGTGGGGEGPTPPPQHCATYDGDSVWIGPIAHYGTAFVTIKVCDGVLTEAGGGVMMSNYEPTNSEAVKAMNDLAVRYYRTDLSLIAYSGATETAAAYRTSLRSAMSQAGI